jgi:hypothetical protein
MDNFFLREKISNLVKDQIKPKNMKKAIKTQ